MDQRLAAASEDRERQRLEDLRAFLTGVDEGIRKTQEEVYARRTRDFQRAVDLLSPQPLRYFPPPCQGIPDPLRPQAETGREEVRRASGLPWGPGATDKASGLVRFCMLGRVCLHSPQKAIVSLRALGVFGIEARGNHAIIQPNSHRAAVTWRAPCLVFNTTGSNLHRW